jgi:hypothetical protein
MCSMVHKPCYCADGHKWDNHEYLIFFFCLAADALSVFNSLRAPMRAHALHFLRTHPKMLAFARKRSGKVCTDREMTPCLHNLQPYVLKTPAFPSSAVQFCRRPRQRANLPLLPQLLLLLLLLLLLWPKKRTWEMVRAKFSSSTKTNKLAAAC